ncbi:hypothetical protein [Rhodococcoides yunnanense]|nr:hypothetical protein [Rhodococcus yunnanensis]
MPNTAWRGNHRGDLAASVDAAGKTQVNGVTVRAVTLPEALNSNLVV